MTVQNDERNMESGHEATTRSVNKNIEERLTCTFTLDHAQTHRIIHVLDSYSRIWMGQYSDIAWNLRSEFSIYQFDVQGVDCAIRCLLEAVRALAIPKLSSAGFSGSYGIWSPETQYLSDGKACNAYDMQQVIRHAEAWHTTPSGGPGVNFDEPWIQGSLPPITCECEGASEASFCMLLHLSPPHCELLREAIEVYALLLELRLRDMFELFFNEPNALELASSLDRLLLNVINREAIVLAQDDAFRLRKMASDLCDQLEKHQDQSHKAPLDDIPVTVYEE